MTKSELHRLLKNPIYVGDFRWLGKVHRGSHEPLVSRKTFDCGQGACWREGASSVVATASTSTRSWACSDAGFAAAR